MESFFLRETLSSYSFCCYCYYPVYYYYYYITIDNYFDILGIEISNQKNSVKTITNKTGEIYRFLNEMPTRDLTP